MTGFAWVGVVVVAFMFPYWYFCILEWGTHVDGFSWGVKSNPDGAGFPFSSGRGADDDVCMRIWSNSLGNIIRFSKDTPAFLPG